jgi:hypothetical protein
MIGKFFKAFCCFSFTLPIMSVQGQIAKSWEGKEADLHLCTSSNLANVLAIGAPYARHDTANECLKRLVLAQQLTGGLTTDGTSS